MSSGCSRPTGGTLSSMPTPRTAWASTAICGVRPTTTELAAPIDAIPNRDIRRLFGEERSLPLRQDDHTGDQFEVLGDAGEVSVGDQRLVERIGFFIRAGQLRFSAGMNGTEDMVVDQDMVVTQVFRRLGKRLDRTRIAAKFDLRINDTSFHRHFPSRDVRSC